MQVDDNKKNVVLVIEDDQDVLSMLVKHLAHMGYEVITARGGMEGLKKLNSEKFDLVITDIVMPIHDGLWLLDQVHQRWPKTVVIMESGALDPATVLTTKQQGAVDFLPKPFGREMVYQALERAAVRLRSDRS